MAVAHRLVNKRPSFSALKSVVKSQMQLMYGSSALILQGFGRTVPVPLQRIRVLRPGVRGLTIGAPGSKGPVGGQAGVAPPNRDGAQAVAGEEGFGRMSRVSGGSEARLQYLRIRFVDQ